MSDKTIKLLIALLINILAVVLTLIWFDWKLLLVVILLMWANNIEQRDRYYG